ncbi:uncharacterized protein LOC121725954 isoform X2 [Aricia agestis]|uniref:uncharacterized protein LOC121725954 isoform X2 n=1 Tax=Aricia agestis TaxID=91739 RepID=UPI001C20B65D|nr:uncharacterized protein LOC121725954 isoform X2 [Aricia agestis]
MYSKDQKQSKALGKSLYIRSPRISDKVDEIDRHSFQNRVSRPSGCMCPLYGGVGGTPQELATGAESGWSRNEIMGPLLDPKIFPLKVGASPETPSSRYNQPNAFLDKLQKKYPMLYDILQTEPTSELKQRVNRDRNKTSYMIDYCETGPAAQFAALQRAADVSGTGPCSQPMRLPGDPCKVRPAPKRVTPKTISKQGASNQAMETRSKIETTTVIPPLGKTEYQDGVSKLGGIIMRDKLHRTKIKNK